MPKPITTSSKSNEIPCHQPILTPDSVDEEEEEFSYFQPRKGFDF